MTHSLPRCLAGLIAGATALALAAPAMAQLSPQEEAIVSAVDAGQDDVIAFHKAIVEINSGTHNAPGVRAVADVVMPELAALGFDVAWIDQSAQGRAGHVFARHTGTPGTTRMLLIGHLDTVFEPTAPFQDYTREGDTVTGPGAEDDKGGVAIMLAALRAMHEAGTLDGANIIVALTGDEESVGSPREAARADLLAAAQESDVALDFEGLARLDGKDMGSIARRSSNSWQVNTTGTEGHSSRIFSDGVGYGAIYELVRILDAFREQLPEEDLTYNVGIIAGGSEAALSDDRLSATAYGKGNIIPPVAVARGDFRTISPEQTERVVAKMEEIVAQNLPGTTATLQVSRGYPPMAPTEGNAALLDRLNAINADLGLEAMAVLPPIMRGAGDINFVAPYVDGLVGLGAAGGNGHAVGEWVDLSSFPRQAKRAAILMSRLAGERP
ncbi:M20/M25/M40 family metallo-hydrolase [Aurantiacibacter xanthus]|uniref:M20/M25/M40 family metallo-hydrolase n=1 Tax=Aurantiacibacter xanthus TaxID=1784712 RepID=A0A3A1P8Y7_9SPHN|nr:M20/M25/M40 family metallo-hydrolase [Aurantiacibacter xanthus]RIV87217.1 M20/M25/M40 family metallo-hydrolase [Aurantiacibacter xanthus]